MILKPTHPVKAYENTEFIKSPDGRIVRVVCEFLEPSRRLKKYHIKDTIVFFGSSRAKSSAQALTELEALKRKGKWLKGKQKSLVAKKTRELENVSRLSKYYDDACELARLLTVWSDNISRGCKKRRFIVCSGGGGGIMEAANKGASYLAKGKTIGFNISIPTEQFPNPFITQDLNFEFHYFFIRKFWFIYLAKALVIFPGGFGTLDELMEVLTLIQTEKVRKKIPILVYGPEYWNEVLNFDALVKWGTIEAGDRKLFQFASTPREAFNYLSKELSRLYL